MLLAFYFERKKGGQRDYNPLLVIEMQKSVSKKQQTSYATIWPEAFKEAELEFIFVINYVILHFKD